MERVGNWVPEDAGLGPTIPRQQVSPLGALAYAPGPMGLCPRQHWLECCLQQADKVTAPPNTVAVRQWWVSYVDWQHETPGAPSARLYWERGSLTGVMS